MVTLESFRSLNGMTLGGSSSVNNGIVFVDDDGGSNIGGMDVVKIVDEESTLSGPPKYEEIFKQARGSNSTRNKSLLTNTSVAPSTSGQAVCSSSLSSDSELSHVPSYTAAVRGIIIS